MLNMRNMNTVNDIFEAFGGFRAVAGELGVKLSTASEMRRRPSIPVKYWPRLVEAAKARKIKGVNYDTLVAIHAGGK